VDGGSTVRGHLATIGIVTGMLEYLAYRAAAAVFGLMPEPLMRRVGRWIGSFVYSRAGRRQVMAIRHMTRVIGSEREVEGAAREAFSAYGRYWAEVMWVRPRRVPAMLERITTEGLDRVREIQAAGRGMIYVLPHVGNWEVAGAVAHDLGLELIAVAEDLPNPRLARWFADVRSKFGIDVVLADGGPALLRTLGEALRRGAAVALVSDRNVGGGGVPVEFFGEQTDLPGGAAALAVRTGVPVFPVAAYFVEGGGHRVVVEAPVDIPTSGPGRVAEGTQRIARALENLIKRQPTQWHILQPNWPSDHRVS
jgi:KDO2-lipid IV(A) lauroyltransferase